MEIDEGFKDAKEEAHFDTRPRVVHLGEQWRRSLYKRFLKGVKRKVTRYTTNNISRKWSPGDRKDQVKERNGTRAGSVQSAEQTSRFPGTYPSQQSMFSMGKQSPLRTETRGSLSGKEGSQSQTGGSTGEVGREQWLPLVHPYSRARQHMNMLIGVCLLYLLIVLPYEVCFNVHVQGLWLTADSVVTAAFLLDVLINFRSGFVKHGEREVKDGLRILLPATIVMKPQAIRCHYLRGWFVVDLLSSLPWDFLLFLISIRRRYWILQVLRSLKILRVHRLSVARSELHQTWSATQRETFEIAVLFFLSLYFSHLCACLWVGVGKMQRDPQRWLDQTHYDRNGTPAVLSEGPQIDVYIASMYFQMVSLATVGYGDIHAGITIPGRAFMTVVNLFGGLLKAYIVGKISVLIILRKERRYNLRERFATLHNYIAREQLPKWLSTRLLVHLSRQWESQIIQFGEVELLGDMTDDMHTEILLNWWRRHVPASLLLPHHTNFLWMLLEKCKRVTFPANDVIARQGERAGHLWILRSGRLAISQRVSSDGLQTGEEGSSDDDVSTGASDSSNQRTGPADGQPKLARLSTLKSTHLVSLHRLPSHQWAEEDAKCDQTDKLLVTELAVPGTVVGETALVTALLRKLSRSRHVAEGRRKNLAVKSMLRDSTVECKTECTLLAIHLDVIFDALAHFPAFNDRFKRGIIRASRQKEAERDQSNL